MKKVISVIAMMVAMVANAQTMSIEDVTIVQGCSAELVVTLESGGVDVGGYEFVIMLPDGISYEGISTDYDVLSMGGCRDGRLKVATILSQFGQTFKDGEVARITISASDDIVPGEYMIKMSEAYVCDPHAEEHELEDASFVLSVDTMTKALDVAGWKTERMYLNDNMRIFDGRVIYIVR